MSQLAEPGDLADALEGEARKRFGQYNCDTPVKIEFHERIMRGDSINEVILNYINEQQMDLVFMGTHGRDCWTSYRVGSVAEHIIRKSTIPIITVRIDHNGNDISNINKIVVPVDFSEPTRDLLNQAQEIALFFESEIELVHVANDYFYPVGLEAGFVSPSDDMLKAVFENRKDQLKRLGNEFISAEIKWDVKVVSGSVSSCIVDQAEDEGHLICMSTHGLSGLSRFILGSVAERVVKMAKCPVMTIHINK